MIAIIGVLIIVSFIFAAIYPSDRYYVNYLRSLLIVIQLFPLLENQGFRNCADEFLGVRLLGIGID